MIMIQRSVRYWGKMTRPKLRPNGNFWRIRKWRVGDQLYNMKKNDDRHSMHIAGGLLAIAGMVLDEKTEINLRGHYGN